MIRRFLTRVLMTILIAICGYNWIQINSLQRQVAELRQQQGVNSHIADIGSEPNRDPFATGWLAQANRHLDNARLALSRSDFDRAKHESLQSLAVMHKAVLEPQVRTKTALAEFNRRLLDLQIQADDLLRKSRPDRVHRK